MTPTRSYLIKRNTLQHAALLTFATTRSPLVTAIFTGLAATFGALKVAGGHYGWKVFSGSEIKLIKKLNEKVDNIKVDMVSAMLSTAVLIGAAYGICRIFSGKDYVPKVVAGLIGFFVGQYLGELGALTFLALKNGPQTR